MQSAEALCVRSAEVRSIQARRVPKDIAMPAQFAATLKALAAGAASMTPAAAIRNIEAWEAHLETVEVSGVKGLQTNLGRLRRLLGAEALDGAAIGKLMVTIAGETGRIAGLVEGKRAESVRQLGAALETAAGGKA